MENRRVWQEISIPNLIHNLGEIRKKVGEGVEVLAVVKANAYGHGANIVAPELEKQGVKYFGVACVTEGIELRKYGITSEIIILGSALDYEIKDVIAYNLTPTISNLDFAHLLENNLIKQKKKLKVHVKVDTGMGRFGVECKDAVPLVLSLLKQEYLEVAGICSHFSSSEADELETQKQLKNFLEIISALEKQNIHIPLKHIANSSGIINFKEAHFNVVRSGLILYGVYPDETLREKISVKPVMQWKTRLIFKKRLPANHGISYNQTYITNKDQQIGIIPVGYSHGFERGLSNKGHVLIHGIKASILGKVCMDHTVIDLSNIDNTQVGDEVVLIGHQQEQSISAEQISLMTQRIPYEILCFIKPNILKVAVESEVVYGH